MTTRLAYDNKAYELLIGRTVNAIESLSRTKGAEYSGDENRLENFVRNAIDANLEPEQILRVYAAKHWDAIGQYIRDLADGKERIRTEPITGRADDLIVYMILFKAMCEARELLASKLAKQK